MGKQVNRYIGSHHPGHKRHAILELGGGLENDEGGNYVIGAEEKEGQVSVKGGRTHYGRPHEARSLFWKIENYRTQLSWKHPR